MRARGRAAEELGGEPREKEGDRAGLFVNWRR